MSRCPTQCSPKKSSRSDCESANCKSKLDKCLEDIAEMTSRIQDLENQLRQERAKRPEDGGEDGFDDGDEGLSGFEKFEGTIENPDGTKTELVAISKNIPPGRVNGTNLSKFDGMTSSSQNNNVMYVSRTHETSVLRPSQNQTQGKRQCPMPAGSGCTCKGPNGTSMSTGQSGAYSSGVGSSGSSRPGGTFGVTMPSGGTCNTSSLGGGTTSDSFNRKSCSLSGRVTREERFQNPFNVLGNMVLCKEEGGPSFKKDSIYDEDKSEEEKKLAEIVEFINSEIFPLIVGAVQGILELINSSDACVYLAKALEDDSSFEEAIQEYRKISKNINCFMQETLGKLSKKLSERQKRHAPQIERLNEGRELIAQAEIALSQEIGKAMGRDPKSCEMPT